MVEDVQKVCKKVTSKAVEIDEMLIQVEVTCDRKGKWFVKMIGFSVMLCQAIIGRGSDTNLSWSNFSSHDGIIRSTLVSKPWIKSNFPNVLKTPSIKFKAIISQFHIRIDIIWSKVACLWYSYSFGIRISIVGNFDILLQTPLYPSSCSTINEFASSLDIFRSNLDE